MVRIYGAHLLMQAVEECTPPVDVGPSTRLLPTPMPRSFAHFPEQKRRLRTEMRAKRRNNPDKTSAPFQKLSNLFMRHVSLQEGLIVASYCAFRDEMDPALLADTLRARGHQIALPVVVGKNMPLSFRLYEQGDVLQTNPMGIQEPLVSSPAIEPDVLLVPMLAFDALRNRLGYGGGFYDRTIAGLRQRKAVLAIGIAYAYQQVPEVPAEPHDMRLDKIVTDVNVL